MKRFISVCTLVCALAFILACAGCSDTTQTGVNYASAQEQAAKDRVIFFGGGTIDDNAASALLFTMDSIDYAGIIISNSDCIYNYAMQDQWKLQSYLSKTSLPISLSDARGFNAFPWSYRNDCYLVWQSPIFTGYGDNAQWPPWPSGDEYLRQQLTQATDAGKPVTLLVTEPITPLSNVLKSDPKLEKGIKRIIWMGGAINVPGNLDPTTIPPEIANKKAEWNAFWDPYAVDWLFKNTTCPLVVFPLDVTDQAKLTSEFMTSLQAQSSQYSYSNLVYSIYSLVQGQPYFEMWNTLTTSYVARPDLFESPISMNLSIITDGFEQGTIFQDPKGRKADVVLNMADKNGFYSYVLSQLKRN